MHYRTTQLSPGLKKELSGRNSRISSAERNNCSWNSREPNNTRQCDDHGLYTWRLITKVIISMLYVFLIKYILFLFAKVAELNKTKF